MNRRKPILYLLLVTLGVILFYNFLVAPMLMRNSYQMGMGMHGGMYYYNNYYIDIRYILIFIIIIAGFVLYELVKPKELVNKCSQCGNRIENERWKICPICGKQVNRKRG